MERKNLDLQNVKFRKNQAKSLMLKFAHSIQKLQNRKTIDYGAIAFDCEHYLNAYNDYQKYLKMETEFTNA